MSGTVTGPKELQSILLEMETAVCRIEGIAQVLLSMGEAGSSIQPLAVFTVAELLEETHKALKHQWDIACAAARISTKGGAQ